MTGSNFNDKEKKTTGGRNGYGAKLANVYLQKFEVECVDVGQGKHFHQTFRDNMSIADEPTVRALTPAQIKKGDYVKISFRPDLKRLKMTHLDKDMVGLFSRRAYDVAASLAFNPGKRLTVFLNKEKLQIKSFEDYIKCLDGVNKPIAFQKNDRWEVGVGRSEDECFRSISFVNSIATTKGGKHVDYITDQIVNHLAQVLKKKKHDVSKSHIKNHLFAFVNCLINNPAFDSQTKENMITKSKDFGSACVLSDTF